MEKQRYYNRLDEFGPQLNKIAFDDPFIHAIMDRYAAGGFLTREEALYQMVLGLANEVSRLRSTTLRFGMPSHPIHIDKEFLSGLDKNEKDLT